MKNLKLFIYCSIICIILSNMAYSQTWSSGSSKLYANPTSTKVGIGITSPVSPLHVQKSLYGPVNEEYRAVIYGYNTSTETSYKNPIGLLGKVNGQNGMAVYGWNLNSGGYGGYFVGKGYFSGNVGIGITSPSQELHVKGDILADGGWLRVNGQRGLYFNDYGGGFYMKDNTWIRTYNDKSFYHNSGTMRTDGTFQVGPNGDRFNVNTNGNIGIANETPSYKLDVNGSINFTGQLLHNGSPIDFSVAGGSDSYWEATTGGIYYNERVGIGTDYPQADLEISKLFNYTDLPTIRFSQRELNMADVMDIRYASGAINFVRIVLQDGIPLSTGTYFSIGTTVTAHNYFRVMKNLYVNERLKIGSSLEGELYLENNDLILENNGHQALIIKNDGKVGIGTENPTEALSVKGKIVAEEVEVKDVAADFVFSENYKLRSIEEVEDYIVENKHLPDVPPSSETIQGVELGEFNQILLQKIEELTLYMIELKKENEELRSKINSLLK